MGREFRVLSVLYKGYPLAPRAFVFCEDASIIGAPFFVMERRRGIVVRRTIPAEFGRRRRPDHQPQDQRGADRYARRPAPGRLPRRSVSATSGKPDGFMRRQIDGWTARYERAKTKEVPIVDEMADWLRDQSAGVADADACCTTTGGSTT